MGQVGGHVRGQRGQRDDAREVRQHAPGDPDRDERPDAGRLDRRSSSLILGLERVNKAIPGALIAVVGTIAASYFFDLAADGVTTLGPVPGRPPAARPADRGA